VLAILLSALLVFNNQAMAQEDIMPFSDLDDDDSKLIASSDSQSVETDVPSFFYFDLELIGSHMYSTQDQPLIESSSLYSSVAIDWYTGLFVVHGGFTYMYTNLELQGYDVGGSIPIKKVFKKNVSFSVFSDWLLVRKGMTDQTILQTIDFGFRAGLAPLKAKSSAYGSTSVFGQPFTNVQTVDYELSDKIIYVGYKYYNLKSDFGLNDFTVYLHVLVGIMYRKAVVHHQDSTGARWTSSLSKTGFTFGAEAGARYDWLTFNLGYYDEIFYLSFGGRIGIFS
ncbi:MAG: hypothetical protein OEZ36_10380, partial [Spirochaetota bacterium]|nr:hypothetical protein [Spirochaetota bacterium]